MSLKAWLTDLEPLFATGGRYQKFYPLYDAVATIFYTSGNVTRQAPHVRDAIDLKRMMILVWLATFPAIFWGIYNIGHQAIVALNFSQTAESLPSVVAKCWHYNLVQWVGGSVGQGAGCGSKLLLGASYFVPLYLVVFVVGGFWEVLFAIIRRHEVNEGFFVTSILFVLTLPPNLPLWQASLGITFGVVVAKELFGGTGHNFMNPALAGRAFLFFSYPRKISGDQVWTVVDGYARATPLAQWAAGGEAALINPTTSQPISWLESFLGYLPGSIGETSTLMVSIGGLALIFARIASWRVVCGVILGMVFTAYLFNFIGSSTNHMFAMQWYWHLVLGGFTFGTFFMATDPVSSAFTESAKWLYGLLIGMMCVLIRVVNPAYPEGMMLAILFANLFAPLFDYWMVQSNIRRRRRRG